MTYADSVLLEQAYHIYLEHNVQVTPIEIWAWEFVQEWYPEYFGYVLH